jgi:chaperonin GroEL
VNILRRALEEPLRAIATNAGRDGAVIIDQVRRKQAEKNDTNLGYEVLGDTFVNMLEAGITDPAKVTRSAVANATSIAGMILTTEALITDMPEKESPMPGGPGGMGGMDY